MSIMLHCYAYKAELLEQSASTKGCEYCKQTQQRDLVSPGGSLNLFQLIFITVIG
jgi:hypothetical protein